MRGSLNSLFSEREDDASKFMNVESSIRNLAINVLGKIYLACLSTICYGEPIKEVTNKVHHIHAGSAVSKMCSFSGCDLYSGITQ